MHALNCHFIDSESVTHSTRKKKICGFCGEAAVAARADTTVSNRVAIEESLLYYSSTIIVVVVSRSYLLPAAG